MSTFTPGVIIRIPLSEQETSKKCMICWDLNDEVYGDDPNHPMCNPCLDILLSNPISIPKCPLHNARITSVNGIPFHWRSLAEIQLERAAKIAGIVATVIATSTHLFTVYVGTKLSLDLQDETDPGLACRILLFPMISSYIFDHTTEQVVEIAKDVLGRLPIYLDFSILTWMPAGLGASGYLCNHVVQPLITHVAPESTAPIATTAACSVIAFAAIQAVKSCFQKIVPALNIHRKHFLEKCTGFLSGLAIGLSVKIIRQNF